MTALFVVLCVLQGCPKAFEDTVPLDTVPLDAAPGDAGAPDSGVASQPDAGVDCTSDDPVTSFLRCNAHPLEPFDAFAPFDDLAPIGAAVIDRDIVMLGESDHGTAEAHHVRLRLIRYLYYTAGFTEFVMEIGRTEAILYQRFLDTGDESHLRAGDVVRSRNYANTEEFFAFLHELRTLVADRPAGLEPLQIYGMDIEVAPHFAARAELLAYLEKAASSSTESTLAPLVSCVTISEACRGDLDEALELFDGAEAELVSGSSPDAFATMRDVLHGLAISIEAQLLWRVGDPAADQRREDLMMERFDAFEGRARGKIVLYAHNLHIAAGLSDKGGWRSIGQHIAETYGREHVYGLALAYYQGAHLGRSLTTGAFLVGKVAPPPDGFFEAYLHLSGFDRSFLDFAVSEPEDPGSAWLHAPVGIMNGGIPIGIRMTPVDHWDGVIFLEAATPPTPLL